MSIKLAVVCIGAPIFSVAIVRRARQLWHDEVRELDVFPVWLLRAFPSAALWMPITLLTAAVGLALGGEDSSSPIASTAGAIGGLVLFIGFAFSASVAVFGRPTAVVPPHLRRRGR